MAPSKLYLENSRKACNAMKRYGIPPRTVRTSLKQLLKLYEKKWKYIEEDDYRVLLDAVLEPEGPKKMEIVKHDFKFIDDPEEDEEEEEEEEEPLKRRPRLRCEATSSNHAGDSCENRGNLCLEYNNNDSKVNKNDDENVNAAPSPYSSEVDIAFSSKGEGKITFSLCKPLRGFCIPNPNAVMKRVEDTYREKFLGFGTGFSVAQVLKDICECFMEEGKTSDHVGSKFPSSDNSKEPTKRYLVADVTRGLEKHEISLVNEVDDEKLPAFTYIKTNVKYNTATVKPMLASISDENSCSDCFGDCLSREVACACAVKTGGEFAYTTEGLVDENFLKNCSNTTLKVFYCNDCPLERMKKRKANQSQSGSCKGHLMRKFIKECWYKCGCGLNCGNRVVQRGIQAKLQVFMTPEGKGWGLRTLEDLPKGTFVCEYVGEIVTNRELTERNEQKKNEEHTYFILLDADCSSERFLKDEEALYLDAMSFGNAARFINHRCVDANMVEIPVEVESPDHHFYHHAFFTTREVKAMEELTWDYGFDFDDDSHHMNAFWCKCGSTFCRAGKRYKRGRRVAASDKEVISRLD